MTKALFSIALLLLLLGCDDIGDSSGVCLCATTAKRFYYADELLAVTIVSNFYQISVRDCCGSGVGFYLERKENMNWSQYDDATCWQLGCVGLSHDIDPTTPFTTTILLPDNPEPGTYRLRIPIADMRASPEPAFVLTNSFEIRYGVEEPENCKRVKPPNGGFAL